MSSVLARIGTRGSPLALWQAEEVRTRLAAALGTPTQRVEIVTIRTTGDAIQDRPLSEAGGKGLFTKEIDAALLAGDIDLAVHSAKDLPTALPSGTQIAACLPRADVREALISQGRTILSDLPHGALIGTASLRRAALVRRLRPDIRTATLRGNVGTRLRKIEAGGFDATLLAVAGLLRLNLLSHAAEILDAAAFPPALGQGTIAVVARTDLSGLATCLAEMDDLPTSQALACERAFLTELEGSCRMPIAGLASIEADALSFFGLVLGLDGRFAERIEVRGAASQAARIGAAAGHELRGRLPADFLLQFR